MADRRTSQFLLSALVSGVLPATFAATSTGRALVLPAPGTNSAATVEDIRGIKGPVEISGSWEWLWWVLALFVLGALAWWLWRKWQQRPTLSEPAITVPPHRRAKDRLRSATELLSDPYRFCSLVSDVVRIYLEERFTLHAPERTTEEFLGEMRTSSSLSPAQKAMLEHFLTRCDLVKFARDEPSEVELKALLEAAMSLIDETAPNEQEQSTELTPEGKG